MNLPVAKDQQGFSARNFHVIPARGITQLPALATKFATIRRLFTFISLELKHTVRVGQKI